MTVSIDVRELVERPGSSKKVVRDERFEDLSTELARVQADAPVHIEVVLESIVEGILVSGPLSGHMSMSCARCLTAFSDPFRVEVAELFTADAGEDEYPLGDGAVDLEPMVRDAVLLAMPFSPLCRADCLGLCERCGGDRNLGECACEPAADPRWAPLEGIRLDLGATDD